jgi:hypothetical protein
MTEDTKLYTRKINYGQSEVWLGTDAKERTVRRMVATNEVNIVTQRHCTPEAFEAFYKDYNTALGHIATLSAPNLDEIASELRLKT